MINGKTILYYRKKRKITQKQLAEGICTTSYLSKIENGQNTASDQTIELLADKLQIKNDPNNMEKVSQVKGMIDEWYKLLKARKGKRADKQKDLIISEIEGIENPDLLSYFQLIDLRHQLFFRNLKNSEDLISEIQTELLSSRLKYYYLHFKGLFCYYQLQYQDALNAYQGAESISIENQFETEPELYYHLGIIYKNLHQNTLSYHYAQRALGIFNHTNRYDRSLDCEILLGINLGRMKRYAEAEKKYINALNSSEDLQLNYERAVICHNIGILYSDMGQHETALDHFRKSYQIKKQQAYDTLLLSIYQIVIEYIHLGNQTNAKRWLNKGLGLAIESESKKQEILFSILHFKVQGNKDQTFESYMTGTAIPFFERKKDWAEQCECLEQLADYYCEHRKYEKASTAFRKCNELRKQNQMM